MQLTPARPHLPGLSCRLPSTRCRGWSRVTHVSGGMGRVSQDKHLSGRFSTNVMLHSKHTCCASKPDQTGSGVASDSRHRRPVPQLCRRRRVGRNEEETRAGITNCSVHEKNPEILSFYPRFPVAVAPLLLSCINMYTTRHFFNLLVKHSRKYIHLKNSQKTLVGLPLLEEKKY